MRIETKQWIHLEGFKAVYPIIRVQVRSKGIKAEGSYDNGKTWQKLVVSSEGTEEFTSAFTFKLPILLT